MAIRNPNMSIMISPSSCVKCTLICKCGIFVLSSVYLSVCSIVKFSVQWETPSSRCYSDKSIYIPLNEIGQDQVTRETFSFPVCIYILFSWSNFNCFLKSLSLIHTFPRSYMWRKDVLNENVNTCSKRNVVNLKMVVWSQYLITRCD